MATVKRSSDVADLGLTDAGAGADRVGGRADAGPAPGRASASSASGRSTGVRVGACLHVTAETANLVRTLMAGGAEVALCASNPLSTQDEVAAALVDRHGVEVLAIHGEDPETYYRHIEAVVDRQPAGHARRRRRSRLRPARSAPTSARRSSAAPRRPPPACSRSARAAGARASSRSRWWPSTSRAPSASFDDRYGTGQSALDGILRATNVLLAGRALVVVGYGALRPRRRPACARAPARR